LDRSAPTSKSSFWMMPRAATIRSSGIPIATATPIAELASSTCP